MGARFAAGLDGGGSKTAFCCMDGGGKVICRDSFGQLNINGMDRPAIYKTLADAVGRIAEMQSSGAACVGMTIATAGISNPECHSIIETGLRAAGYRGPFDLRGDHEAALHGAVGRVGLVLIAGTGSICFGRSAQGQTARAGGWGYLLDDEGGGYALGRDILKAVLRAADGRAKPTALIGAVYRQFSASRPEDLIRAAYDPALGKANIAGLAPLLQEAVDGGDTAAKVIADHADKELAAMCAAVVDKLRLSEAVLALSGSILTNIMALREALEIRLKQKYPLLRVITPLHDAAWGAADLARETYLENNPEANAIP